MFTGAVLMYSEILKQSFDYRPDRSILFADGTFYAKGEVEKVKGKSDGMKRSIHIIKKVLQGELV